VRLVAERSMTPAFETARMYAGDVPDTDGAASSASPRSSSAESWVRRLERCGRHGGPKRRGRTRCAPPAWRPDRHAPTRPHHDDRTSPPSSPRASPAAPDRRSPRPRLRRPPPPQPDADGPSPTRRPRPYRNAQPPVRRMTRSRSR
jgi:hypothetical protein